jgi:hypothetical protein
VRRRENADSRRLRAVSTRGARRAVVTISRSPSRGSGGCASTVGVVALPLAASSSQSPGTPFNWWIPRGAKPRPEYLALDLHLLRHRFDHHPNVPDGTPQVICQLDLTWPGGLKLQCLLDVVGVLGDVGLGFLPLLFGEVEDSNVAARRDVNRSDPLSERASSIDRNRALVDVLRESEDHGTPNWS